MENRLVGPNFVMPLLWDGHEIRVLFLYAIDKLVISSHHFGLQVPQVWLFAGATGMYGPTTKCTRKIRDEHIYRRQHTSVCSLKRR